MDLHFHGVIAAFQLRCPHDDLEQFSKYANEARHYEGNHFLQCVRNYAQQCDKFAV